MSLHCRTSKLIIKQSLPVYPWKDFLSPTTKQFLPGLEEREKSADAENSETLRWFQICKS